MKLSEYENEDALELLADILEPTARIFADGAISQLYSSGAPKIKLIQTALKKHSKELVEILARLEGVKPKEYKGNIITMTKTLLDVLNDEGLKDFFSLQAQTEAQTSSTSATENIEDNEQ